MRPSSGVVVGGDTREGGEMAAGPAFLDVFRDVGQERDSRGDDFLEVCRVVPGATRSGPGWVKTRADWEDLERAIRQALLQDLALQLGRCV